MLLLLLLRAASKPHGQSTSRGRSGRSGSSRPQAPLLLLREPGSSHRGCSRQVPQARHLPSASSSLLRPQSPRLLQSPGGLVQQSVRRLLPRYSIPRSQLHSGVWAAHACPACRPRFWPQSLTSLMHCSAGSMEAS